MVRIRDTLEAARLQGTTPWAALGQLGDDVDVDEPATSPPPSRWRPRTVPRCATVRAGRVDASQGPRRRGGPRGQSQSMLVAQLLLCVGLLFHVLHCEVLGG